MTVSDVCGIVWLHCVLSYSICNEGNCIQERKPLSNKLEWFFLYKFPHVECFEALYANRALSIICLLSWSAPFTQLYTFKPLLFGTIGWLPWSLHALTGHLLAKKLCPYLTGWLLYIWPDLGFYMWPKEIGGVRYFVWMGFTISPYTNVCVVLSQT